MEQKTIKDYTETELKAIAYDQVAVSQNAQSILTAINEELKSRQAQPITDVPIPVPEVVEKKNKKK